MFEHLPAYLRQLQDEDKSPRTLEQYRYKIAQFSRWLEGRPLDRQALQDYRTHLQERGIRPRTVRVTYTALYGYLEYLQREGLARDLPPRGSVKLPRLDAPQRRTPTAAEFAAIWDAARRLPAHRPRLVYERTRALAVLALLSYAGLRRSELLSLDVSDLLPGEPWHVRVRCGKGGESAQVPVSSETQAILQDYLRELARWKTGRDMIEPAASALWPVDRNRKMGGFGLDSIISSVLGYAGLLDSGITPHSFRHWLASALDAQDGTGIATVSRILRHRNISTTFNYLKSDPQAAQDAINRLQPPPTNRSPQGGPFSDSSAAPRRQETDEERRRNRRRKRRGGR